MDADGEGVTQEELSGEPSRRDEGKRTATWVVRLHPRNSQCYRTHLPTHLPTYGRSSYFGMTADAEGLSLKRKKTVTWADGEQLPEVGRQGQQEGEESDGGGGPGVVVLPSTDFLFAELDTDIVMEQQGAWVQRW